MPRQVDLTLPLDEQHDQRARHINFDMPPSASSSNFEPYSASAKKHFSIDLSLELERQLDLESLPSTPAHVSHPRAVQPPLSSLPTARPGSPVTAVPGDVLDAQILAHIVTQLRESLAAMTKERDDLLNLVSTAHSTEAQLKDALQLITDKATDMEEELMEARVKIRDDEDAIKMLRAKVDESRRGLMQLQTQKQNRRQSVQGMSIDLSRTSLSSLGGPVSSKRASFTPLTGSSMTDGMYITSPGTLALPDAFSPPGSAASGGSVSRRISGIFGRGSPPHEAVLYDAAEVDALRKEIITLKRDLDETRHELTEATEAKDASETCVQALRAFIQDNNVGKSRDENSVSDHSSLIMRDDSEEKKDAGWGFKLWKVDTNVKVAPGPPSAASTTSNHTRALSMSSASPTSTTPTGQFAKKFGGFFSGRATTPAASAIPTPPIAAMQPNPRPLHRDSMYSTSDSSSVVEPLSPIGEFNRDVLVRDNSSLSDSGSPNELKARMEPLAKPVLS